MDIGTGIAIAGAWLFAGMVSISASTSNLGMWLGIFCAIGVTVFLGT